MQSATMTVICPPRDGDPCREREKASHQDEIRRHGEGPDLNRRWPLEEVDHELRANHRNDAEVEEAGHESQ